MNLLERPEMLFVLVPWAIVCAVLYWRQWRILGWIAEHTGERRRGELTAYARRGMLPLHMAVLFLAGFCLLYAAAGPYETGVVEQTRNKTDVILAVDSSFSMYAGDQQKHYKGKKDPGTRFGQAKQIALELVRSMPGSRIGLISFSGQAPIHSPPTTDHKALKDHIKSLNIHYYLKTGSSFKAIFDAILHLFEYKRESMQLVIISDGEMPYEQDYSEELKLLAKNKIIVHAVGIGRRGESEVNLYNPEDVKKSRSNPRTAKTITTRRVDEHLEEFTDETGGKYIILAEADKVETLVAEIDRPRKQLNVKGQGKIYRTTTPIVWFLLFFFLDILVFHRRALGDTISAVLGAMGSLFRSARAAQWLVLISTVLFMHCLGDLGGANRLNVKGIDAYEEKNYDEAMGAFEKSMAYRQKPEVPTVNLGLTYHAKKDYATASRKYQQAMEIEPELKEAFFNDGHSLYEWGKQELDLKKCRFKRTEKMWIVAIQRFRRSAQLAFMVSPFRFNANRNADTISAILAEIKKKCQGKSNKKDKKKQNQQDKKDQNKGGKGQKQSKGSKGGKGGKGQKGGKGGKGGAKGEPQKTPPKMSKEERDQVKQARKRMKKNKPKSSHKQTTAQQNRKGKKSKGGGGPELWW